ncbi:ParB/RepB/Spo0J family partition protein [Herbaspirillum sp. GCM10030257]|uniref:ParB/RepB/Spo0J family partition protein n=1 Tax=Herbaspirillum sp. GCM10030257 TaxID=3273393 RepID=UPI0036176E2E
MVSKKFAELTALTAGVTPTKDAGAEPGKIRSAPGQVMEFALQRDQAVKRAEEAESRMKELEAQLLSAKEEGGALEVALDALTEVPGRRRKLTDEEYEDLKNNLAHNPLASPITVRVTGDGKYEVVSGHNRVQAYRDLGRTTIKAWLADATDDEAEDLAFFANALAAKLPDYDKFRGYERIIAKHPQLDRQTLASRVGISDSQLGRLLAFKDLPAEAHAMLAEKPHLLGASAAEALSALSKKGRNEYVVQGLRKLAVGELKLEAEAVKFATDSGKEKVAPLKAEPTSFKLGKAKYATLRTISKTIRVDCMSDEEAEILSNAIREVIEKRVNSLKNG